MARRLGLWPLLLGLAGSAARHRLARGDTPQAALDYLAEAYDNEGVVAFDHRNPQQRHQAAESTITVSLDLLSEEERRQYRSLAIFAEDVDVPLSTVAILLGLSKFKTGKVAGVLADLSLLRLDLAGGTLRLHDVMRSYLARDLSDAATLHARLADAWSAPEKLGDSYAWRYAAYHHARAVPSGSVLERHHRIKGLVDLVTDPGFQAGHRAKLSDPPALRADLQTALCLAAEDRDPEAPSLVSRVAWALAGARGPDSAALFDYARQGLLQKAQQLLLDLKPDEGWRQAIRLVLAWEAAAAGHHGEAAALVGSTQNDISPHDSTLQALLQRVRSVIDPNVPPPGSLLPPAPDPFIVSEILKRLGGASLTPIEPLMRGLDIPTNAARAYVAEQDGPLLVAFAADGSEENTAAVKQYIAAHASNPYPYSGHSLWLLIPAVVQHPDPEWTRDILKELIAGALSGAKIDFAESLPLTLQALKARAGDLAARAAFEQRTQQAVTEVQKLSPERSENDPWAYCLRRLVILAEIHHQILDQPETARQLLDQALALPFDRNFAGFRAPACLMLAEGMRVCRHDAAPTIGAALDAALAAAHNVQDPQFCARTIARVNAMRIRWWPRASGGIDPAATIEKLIRDPLMPEFQALHIVGESYHHRVNLPTRVPLPDGMRGATSLRDILACYDIVGEVAEGVVLGLNPGPAPDAGAALPTGWQLSIPDPEFAPLLATRLAAEALRVDKLSPAERTWLIQRLTPVAQTNLTALDTVAARLLMAALPIDARTLELIPASLT
jgi:hypothetical protein